MAKKDDAPAISLFSFQDIITSLTGIMFLIVLLLIIFMLEMRPRTEDVTDLESTESIPQITEEQLSELETQIKLFRDRRIVIQARLDELKKMDLEHIQTKVLVLRMETRDQLEKIETLSQNTRRSQDTIEEKKLDISNEEKEMEKMKKEMEKLEEQIKIQEEALKSRQAQTLFFKKALPYTIENGSSLKPVLAECTKDGVRILDVSTGEKFDLRDKNGTFLSRKNTFLDWVKGRSFEDEYYTILIKPESFEFGVLADDLKNMAAAKGTRIERGIEILPDDELSIFGDE